MTDFMAELGPLALASRLRRLSERMMQQCGEVYGARGFDFQPGWFPLVYLLSTRGPSSPSEATRALGVTAASVSQMARELVRKRLVSSRKDRGDGRRRILDLTGKGKRLAAGLEPLWEDIRQTAEAILNESGLDLDVLALLEHAFDRGALREGVSAMRSRDPEPAVAIRTPRLVLRPFAMADADAFLRLAGDPRVADQMISLPPLRRATLEYWIRSHHLEFARGSAIHLAVSQSEDQTLLGAVELRDIDMVHRQGELSFWFGQPSWGQGFATEAARSVVRFAFEDMGLNRVYAYHMVRNEASGRVLERLGMQQEGLLHQRVLKNGVFEDVLLWAVVRDAWERLARLSS